VNPFARRPTADAPDATTELLDDAEARQLIHAAQQYDDRALARIYHLYAERIFRYIYFRLGEHSRAEELTGEVFVRLLENVAAFRLGAEGHALALTGWLYRIAHNLIVDEYRRHHARAKMEPLPESWHDDIEVELPEDFQLTRADLQIALRNLTDEQQTVIIMRFAEEMTNAEIARVLGKTETAVKALQRRGLAAMARYLAPTAPPRRTNERMGRLVG
jgi:RNA polymerase sigma-70 factor (ECF subfamily)